MKLHACLLIFWNSSSNR